MLVWLEPVQVMQLRFVCQAYREEARKAIQVVGLIDDYENHKEAMSLGKSFVAVWRVCWGDAHRFYLTTHCRTLVFLPLWRTLAPQRGVLARTRTPAAT